MFPLAKLYKLIGKPCQFFGNSRQLQMDWQERGIKMQETMILLM